MKTMNSYLVKSILMAASFFASLSAVQAATSDTKTVMTPLDESACGENGQCAIFEVVIQLSFSASFPVVRQTSDVIVVNNTANPYGATVRRQADTCSKQVHVPRDVYRAIIQIMASLSGQGEQAPALTPAQQTILLFYTTLMQQTLQFQCDAKDLGGSAAPTTPPSTPTNP